MGRFPVIRCVRADGQAGSGTYSRPCANCDENITEDAGRKQRILICRAWRPLPGLDADGFSAFHNGTSAFVKLLEEVFELRLDQSKGDLESFV